LIGPFESLNLVKNVILGILKLLLHVLLHRGSLFVSIRDSLLLLRLKFLLEGCLLLLELGFKELLLGLLSLFYLLLGFFGVFLLDGRELLLE